MVEMLGYMRWDAVFLCFDVMDKVQMLSIISWVRKSLPRDGQLRGELANGISGIELLPRASQPISQHHLWFS